MPIMKAKQYTHNRDNVNTRDQLQKTQHTSKIRNKTGTQKQKCVNLAEPNACFLSTGCDKQSFEEFCGSCSFFLPSSLGLV